MGSGLRVQGLGFKGFGFEAFLVGVDGSVRLCRIKADELPSQEASQESHFNFSNSRGGSGAEDRQRRIQAPRRRSRHPGMAMGHFRRFGVEDFGIYRVPLKASIRDL